MQDCTTSLMFLCNKHAQCNLLLKDRNVSGPSSDWHWGELEKVLLLDEETWWSSCSLGQRGKHIKKHVGTLCSKTFIFQVAYWCNSSRWDRILARMISDATFSEICEQNRAHWIWSFQFWLKYRFNSLQGDLSVNSCIHATFKSLFVNFDMSQFWRKKW